MRMTMMLSKQNVSIALLAAVASIAGIFGTAIPVVWAAEFSEAELFFELNDTDGDLGIHASIDGGPYTRLTIEDSQERVIFDINALGSLARQGLTQLFFESAEPSFDELAPATFFRRFPEGEYEIDARPFTGEELEATVVLSHVLAAPVGNIMVNNVPAARNCNAVPLPSVSAPVTIDWDPVTRSHPRIGKSGSVTISRYQFFVQQGDTKFSIDLPPTVTRFQVPPEITASGGTFKFEIIARTTSNNNTAVESCFTISQGGQSTLTPNSNSGSGNYNLNQPGNILPEGWRR